MKYAHGWRPHCPSSWPAWAREWAGTRGSLTRRLVGLNEGFRVEPVVQNRRLAVHPGNLPRQGGRSGVMRQRLVRLHVGQRPVVLAQTLIQTRGPVNDWRFWRGLGSRSLGSMLFSDPRVHRGNLYFARLASHEGWVLELLPTPVRQALASRPRQASWYARCARFSRQPHRTPLWVMEVFLPPLENYL